MAGRHAPAPSSRYGSRTDQPAAGVPGAAAPKVAAVGVGRWGGNILRDLEALGALAAAAEVDDAVRARLNERFPGLAVFHCYQDVLDSDVEAVAIATPAPTHYDLVHAALEADKDVFVEKPLALSAQQGRKLVALAEARRRVLQVGHLLLYQPALQWIKAYLRAGHLGELRYIKQERYGAGPIREVENVLWCMGSHDISVQLYLLEALPQCHHRVGHRILQDRVDDDVHLHLRYPGGIDCFLHTSWAWPSHRRQLTIGGTRGTLVYDELNQKVTRYSNGPSRTEHWPPPGEHLFTGDPAPLALEMADFLRCIRERTSPLSDGHFALRVIEVIESAMRD